MWEAQWTPFFHTSYPNCSDGSVSVSPGLQIELPHIQYYQVLEYPTGKWSPPERRIIIPWGNETWLDITKLNLVHNRE